MGVGGVGGGLYSPSPGTGGGLLGDGGGGSAKHLPIPTSRYQLD
jgi:hypothetical protein